MKVHLTSAQKTEYLDLLAEIRTDHVKACYKCRNEEMCGYGRTIDSETDEIRKSWAITYETI